MQKNEKSGKWEARTWAMWLLGILLFLGLSAWLYQTGKPKKVEVTTAGKPEATKEATPPIDAAKVFLCPCGEEKKKRAGKGAPSQKRKKAPKQIAKAEPKASAPATSVAEDPPKVEAKSLFDGVDPDFGKTKMAFIPLPEKEEEPPRRGRKIYVLQQSAPPPQYFYGGGYGYSTGGTPQVIYGGTPTFVPNPPVIVPAPSVTVPAGGHAPGYTTKPAGPGYTTL